MLNVIQFSHFNKTTKETYNFFKYVNCKNTQNGNERKRHMID